MKRVLTQLFYAFPSQLLLLHLRSNQLPLLLWVLLLLFASGNLGATYGVNYLFISPEYRGTVGFGSFLLMGLAFGALTMTWHLTTYLLDAQYFPFLATLKRPFTKFCLNNSVLPILFGAYLLGQHVYFQWYYEYEGAWRIFWNCLGFVAGNTVFIFFAAGFLGLTNKDIFSFLGKRTDLPPNLAPAPGRRTVSLEEIRDERTKWRVDTYLTERLKWRLVRSVAHYDSALLKSVYRQNHTNAFILELLILAVLILLGLGIDSPLFRIPAGASIFLLAAIVMGITGAVAYWFPKWRFVVIIALLFAVNWLTRYDAFHHRNVAYGLDYAVPPATYSNENLEAICAAEQANTDKAATEAILNTWLAKRHDAGDTKPKMVLFCVSGGGLKSALWAVRVLQELSRQTEGDFMQQTVLMSGASGGMIGTAYYRELYLRQLQGQAVDPNAPEHLDNIAKDLLNSIGFTIATNDIFLPMSEFADGERTYTKDRGYTFEQQLNDNVGGVFDKRLVDYRAPEQAADIPLTFITPSVINDGRRMIISPQGVVYMMAAPIAIERANTVEIDAVDFGRLFREQDAYNLRYTTALRMNATYPYILPSVFLPTEPTIELTDAGFRDNFGLKSAVRFISVFQDWIKANTDGVVLVQVRGYDRDRYIASSDGQGFVESLLDPIGIAGQVISLQNYEHDTNLGFVYDVLGKDNFDIVPLTYLPTEKNQEAPISFHLTRREKADILEAMGQARNQEQLRRLLELLE